MILVIYKEFVAHRGAAQRGRKKTWMVARSAGRHYGVQRSVRLESAVSGDITGKIIGTVLSIGRR